MIAIKPQLKTRNFRSWPAGATSRRPVGQWPLFNGAVEPVPARNYVELSRARARKNEPQRLSTQHFREVPILQNADSFEMWSAETSDGTHAGFFRLTPHII
jgi:hypothetical protein